MGNGGILPQCAVCKWHSGLDDNNQSELCKRHQISVKSHQMVCSDIDSGCNIIGIRLFALTLKRRAIYLWVEVAYQDARYIGLPMYYHEKVKLASIQQYAGWTDQKIDELCKSTYEKVRKNFLEKYDGR